MTRNLVSLLLSTPEFCGCAVASKELGLIHYSCLLLQNFSEVRNKTKNLVFAVFCCRISLCAYQDEEFGLTAVF
jgi:hypothetical protein